MDLCSTDTDSLILFLQTDDIYRNLLKKKHLYDFSNYAKDHFLYNSDNAGILEKFKDECKGSAMHEFVGLKHNLYSYSYENISSTEKKEKQVAKGIQKATIIHCLRHEHYKQCIFTRKDTMHRMDTIRSFEHNIFITRINKTFYV